MLENLKSTPIALISDPHANLEALETVLKHIHQQGIKTIICLGDIVGYGPDPEMVVDLISRNCELSLIGNHDWALLHDPYGFNYAARNVIRYTQRRMKPRAYHLFGRTKRRWEYLKNLPQKYEENNILMVHASVQDPIGEYVCPDRMSGYNSYRIRELFPDIKGLCFYGHTHYPCVINEESDCWYPQDKENTFVLESEQKYIINVGSVGQPRDNDPRTCYVIFDGEKVEYHRLEYDVEKTIAKISALGFDQGLIRKLQKKG